jgi:hypothetical protein
VSPRPLLADAAERLRGRPGRPRTRPPAAQKADPVALAAVAALPARLVDLAGAARYLGNLSPWSVRDLITNGTLRRVRLPGAGGADLRRVLLDVRDLDQLIEQSKDCAEAGAR